MVKKQFYSRTEAMLSMKLCHEGYEMELEDHIGKIKIIFVTITTGAHSK